MKFKRGNGYIALDVHPTSKYQLVFKKRSLENETFIDWYISLSKKPENNRKSIPELLHELGLAEKEVEQALEMINKEYPWAQFARVYEKKEW
ncbi:MAG: hypothetical protein ACP6IS_12490 [Candidatus Asgardarchaeia archaeon]